MRVPKTTRIPQVCLLALWALTRLSSEPEARAVAIVERLLALMHDCRAVVPQLELANVTELIPYMSSSAHYGKLRLRAQ